MDYMSFVNYHRDNNADITIGCIPYGSDRAKEFGLMKINEDRKIMVRGGGGLRTACVKHDACTLCFLAL